MTGSQCSRCYGLEICGCGAPEPIPRRERIATAVLAGFAHTDRALNLHESNARYAIAADDALIAELDK